MERLVLDLDERLSDQTSGRPSIPKIMRSAAAMTVGLIISRTVRDLVCYCDFYAGYDALWEQKTPHERVEQFGARVMRHERPWTRQHWIHAA